MVTTGSHHCLYLGTGGLMRSVCILCIYLVNSSCAVDGPRGASQVDADAPHLDCDSVLLSEPLQGRQNALPNAL